MEKYISTLNNSPKNVNIIAYAFNNLYKKKIWEGFQVNLNLWG